MLGPPCPLGQCTCMLGCPLPPLTGPPQPAFLHRHSGARRDTSSGSSGAPRGACWGLGSTPGLSRSLCMASAWAPLWVLKPL